MVKAKAPVYFAVLTPTFHGVFTSHDEFDDKIKDAPVFRGRQLSCLRVC